MPRRRRPRHHRDPRPSWDAPFLPCPRDYHMPDGTRRTEVTEDYERRYRAHLMDSTPPYNFRLDPTYDMKRKPHP